MPGKKDPNKPKGRMSAYAFFVQERRKEYKEKGKNIQFTEFSKECADLWREMDEDEKKDYSDLADKDKVRYEREMAAYRPPSDDEDGGTSRGKSKKKKKDANMPKRSMSAFFFSFFFFFFLFFFHTSNCCICRSGFMFFCSKNRPKLKEKHPSATVGELAKQLGAAWKLMTDDQKKPFEEMHRQDRIRYEREMESYRKNKGRKYAAEEDEEDDVEDV